MEYHKNSFLTQMVLIHTLNNKSTLTKLKQIQSENNHKVLIACKMEVQYNKLFNICQVRLKHSNFNRYMVQMIPYQNKQ